VDLGAAFVADERPLELVQVREGAIDDPADGAEAGAVLGAAASDDGSDPASANEPAVLVVVVAISPITWSGRRRGRPTRPPTAGTRGRAAGSAA
jgi:hypothetical protein